MEKISKKGRKFYGCEGYPECSFISWDKPTAERCPQCGSSMIEKRTRKGELLHLCANENCRFKTKSQTPEEEADDE